MTRGFVFSFKKTLTGGGILNDLNRHKCKWAAPIIS